MIVYTDTSAMIKLVVQEEGSDQTGAVWNQGVRRATSCATYAEGIAALSAMRRDRRLGQPDYDGAIQTFRRRYGEALRITLTDKLARRAGALAAQHGLRGYDAIHLASALGAVGPGVVFLTWDVAQARAARVEGLTVAGIRL